MADNRLINEPTTVKSSQNVPIELLRTKGAIGGAPVVPEPEAPTALESLSSGLAGMAEGGLGLLGLMANSPANFGILSGAADLLGADKVANAVIAGAKTMRDYQDEVGKNVPGIGDVQNLGELGTWFKHTGLSMLPEMGGMLGAAAKGAKAASMLPGHIVEDYIEKHAERAIAKGTAPEVAVLAAKQSLEKKASEYGAMAGGMAVTAPLETGRTFASDVEERGIEKANATAAIAAGIGKSLIESFGPEMDLAKRYLGKSVSPAVQKSFAKDLKNGLAKATMDGLSAAGKEGLEEGLQSTVDLLHKKYAMQQELNIDDYRGVIESAIGGALMGTSFGAVKTGMDYHDSKYAFDFEEIPDVDEIVEQEVKKENPVQKRYSKAAIDENILYADMNKANSTFNEVKSAVDTELLRLNDVEKAARMVQDPQERESIMQDVQNKRFQLAAQLSKANSEKKTWDKNLAKEHRKVLKKKSDAENDLLLNVITEGPDRDTYKYLKDAVTNAPNAALKKQAKDNLNRFIEGTKQEISQNPYKTEFSQTQFTEDKRALTEELKNFLRQTEAAKNALNKTLEFNKSNSIDPDEILDTTQAQMFLDQSASKIKKTVSNLAKDIVNADESTMWDVRSKWEDLRAKTIEDMYTGYRSKQEGRLAAAEENALDTQTRPYNDTIKAGERAEYREVRDEYRIEHKLEEDARKQQEFEDRLFEEALLRNENEKQQEQIRMDYYKRMEDEQFRKQYEALRKERLTSEYKDIEYPMPAEAKSLEKLNRAVSEEANLAQQVKELENRVASYESSPEAAQNAPSTMQLKADLETARQKLSDASQRRSKLEQEQRVAKNKKALEVPPQKVKQPTFLEADPVNKNAYDKTVKLLEDTRKSFNAGMKPIFEKAVADTQKKAGSDRVKVRRKNKYNNLKLYDENMRKEYRELQDYAKKVVDPITFKDFKKRVDAYVDKAITESVETRATALGNKVKNEIAQAKRAADKAAAEAARPKNQREKVQKWVSEALDKMPSVKNSVVFADLTDENGPNVPKAVKEAYEEGAYVKGVFDEKTGKVYIFADRCKDKRQAMRTFLHETVAHHGLRSLMTPTELNGFLKTVYESFKDTTEFKRWLGRNSKYAGEEASVIAEEYVASIAAKMDVGETLNKADQNLFRRIKTFVKKLLTRKGFSRVTETDVKNVLTASMFNLARDTQTKSSKDNISSYRKKARIYRDASSKTEALTKLFPSSDFVKDIKTGWKGHRTKLTELGTAIAHGKLEKVTELLQDNLQRAYTIIEAHRNAGLKVDESADFYASEIGSSNRTSERMHKFVEKYLEGPDGLKDRLAKAMQPDWTSEMAWQKLDTLAQALHARERNEMIRKRTDGKNQAGSGITDADADAIIKELGLNNPELMAAAEKLRDINNFRLDLLDKYRLLPAEVVDSWRKSANWYVPLKGTGGWEDMMQTVMPGYARKGAGSQYAAPSWKGSVMAKGRKEGSIAASPTIHSILQTEDTIRMIETARQGRALLKFAEDMKGKSDVFEIESKENRGFHNAVDRSTGKVKLTRDSKSFRGMDEHVITVIDDKGHQVRIFTPDLDLANAIKGTNMSVVPKFIRMVGSVTRAMGKLMTSLSLPFVTKNAPRDYQTAMMNLEEVIKTENLTKGTRRRITANLKGAGKAMYDNLRGRKSGTEWDKWIDMFRDSGAYTSMYGFDDFDSQKSALVKGLKEVGADGNWFNLGKQKTKQVIDYIEALSNSLENTTRLATFREVYEQKLEQHKAAGKSDAEAHALAQQKAMEIALDLTVNFTKKGTLSPWLGPLYLFANASIQSNTRLLKTILSSPETATKVIGACAALSFITNFLAEEMMGDDEDGVAYFDKIPTYVREQNYILPLGYGDGKYITIPNALGFNTFNILGDAMYDAFRGKEDLGRAASAVFSNTFNTFMPTGNIEEGVGVMFAPSLIQPLVRLNANKSFTGLAIKPEDKNYMKGDYPESEKAWSNTSQVLVGFCQGLNELFGGNQHKSSIADISPETLSFLFKSYTGGFGSMANQIFKATEDCLSGNELEWRNVPMINRFVGEVGTPEQVGYYMNIQSKVDKATTLLEYAKERGATEEVAEIRKEYAKELALKNYVKTTGKRMKRLFKLRKRMNKEYRNGETTLGEYNRKRENLDKRRVNAMQRTLKRASELDYRPTL